MDDTLLFIPPCCVNKKLPQAIMQAPHRALSFYTHGDVMMDKFYRAVSYLISDPHVMVLSMPVVATDTVVFLQQCFERGWVTDLVLSTARDISSVVRTYLSMYQDHVLYAHSSDVSDLSSHLVLYSQAQALSISGPLYDRHYRVSLAAYTMLYHPSYDVHSCRQDWGSPLRNILLPDILRHRPSVIRSHTKLPSLALDHFIHLELPPY